MSNYTPDKTMSVITYPCPLQSQLNYVNPWNMLNALWTCIVSTLILYVSEMVWYTNMHLIIDKTIQRD